MGFQKIGKDKIEWIKLFYKSAKGWKIITIYSGSYNCVLWMILYFQKENK